MTSENEDLWPVIPDEDLLRAQVYHLLGRLLARPPGPELLASVAALEGDDSDLGSALRAMARTAQRRVPAQVEEEYHALFGDPATGRTGELTPTASFCLTGSADGPPLERLRADMARLEIVRAEDVCGTLPDDHIASLCEIMSGLITGTLGAPADLVTQHAFFNTHLANWAPRFFQDLEAARAAAFYMPVGSFGRRFLSIEGQAFALAA